MGVWSWILGQIELRGANGTDVILFKSNYFSSIPISKNLFKHAVQAISYCTRGEKYQKKRHFGVSKELKLTLLFTLKFFLEFNVNLL